MAANSDLRICSIDGCGSKHYAKGLCRRDYNASRPRAPYRYDPRRKKGCLFAACDEQHYLDGVCARHYRGGRVDPTPPSYDPSNANLLYKYGITRDERDSLFLAQDGLCSICRVAAATHIDHDHAHGCSDSPKRGCRDCVRGGVCSRCNTTLSAYEGNEPRGAAQELLDNPWWIARGNFYLRARPFSGTYRREAA